MIIYKLIIEYNGKNFHGSQIQSSVRTVEGVLNNVLRRFLKYQYKLYLSSRTDSGVSSLCTLGKLVCSEKIEPKEFLRKINYFLPNDLKIVDIKKTKKNFDIRNVKYKVYKYIIYNSEYNPPTVFGEYVWWVKEKIYLELLKKSAKIISSQKKFNFATTKDYIETKKNTGCKIDIKIRKEQSFIFLVFKGKRFTHRLIRNIVSLIVDVATKKITIKQLKEIISNWKYCKTKPAPANGLILVKTII